MVRGLVVPAVEDAAVELGDFTQLEDYQAVVGGYVEPVDIPSLGVTIYVNEERLRRQLPFDSRATFLWWYEVHEARQTAMLVGDAAIVGIPNRRGESTDVPHSLVDILTKAGAWRIQVKSLGDPRWHQSHAIHTDYFEALIVAMVTVERWTSAVNVRIVPVPTDELPGGVAPASAA
ncbi:DUF3846 domain-containing protein [Microbacterium sp. BH-3-3-3]|uniref:DUF3846 domain-containing protein n=1 Tax=Microbacterium sp. BH-3-3-3 TaxID=1906742 RepID=UPI00089293ED|nr:DUF3846 domain-containing protein [Microbacterium sp. BH-3-3-3]AOX46833.1 hypothetical protein BJP65_14375 [Microbacterium sp. BH-3-3-3]